MTNRVQDSFDSIIADSQLKEETKQFLSEQRSRKISRWSHPVFRRALAVVCTMLVLLLGAGGYSWVQKPVSYVSIDVNPSIELALNRYDKVVSVTAYNKEGEGIIEGLVLKGKGYTEAIDVLMDSEDMQRYLTDQAELVFTVAADHDRESALKTGVENLRYNSSSFLADLSIVPEAHEHHISVGKYNAYLELSQYDDTVTVDDCQHMSMSEIHGLIDQHHAEHENTSEDETHHTETHH